MFSPFLQSSLCSRLSLKPLLIIHGISHHVEGNHQSILSMSVRNTYCTRLYVPPSLWLMTSGSRFHILHSDTAVIGQEYELCEFIIIFSLPALLPCCITKNTTARSICVQPWRGGVEVRRLLPFLRYYSTTFLGSSMFLKGKTRIMRLHFFILPQLMTFFCWKDSGVILNIWGFCKVFQPERNFTI